MSSRSRLIKNTFDAVRQAVKEFIEDDCSTMAAALAYYTVFALPPLLVVIIAIAGLAFGQDAVRGSIAQQIQALIGQGGAEEVQTMIRQASQSASGGVIATIVGIIALLFGATGAFAQLQAALNRAWQVKPDPHQGGVKTFLKKRLLSFGMILALAFLVMVSLALSAGLTAFGTSLAQVLGSSSKWTLLALNLSLSFVVLAALFGAIYRVLPDAEVAWNDVWIGAIATALLFLLGKFLIGFYVGKSHIGSTFGAAGALALLLVWVYYSSMLVLFGAEFTQTWAKRRGHEIRPSNGAVRLKGGPREEPAGT